MSEDDLWTLFHALWGQASMVTGGKLYEKSRWIELQRKLEQLERLALPVDPVTMYQVRCQSAALDLVGRWVVAATNEAMAIVAVKMFLTQSQDERDHVLVNLSDWSAWETAVPVRVK